MSTDFLQVCSSLPTTSTAYLATCSHPITSPTSISMLHAICLQTLRCEVYNTEARLTSIPPHRSVSSIRPTSVFCLSSSG